jgi:hypothetical protein
MLFISAARVVFSVVYVGLHGFFCVVIYCSMRAEHTAIPCQGGLGTGQHHIVFQIAQQASSQAWRWWQYRYRTPTPPKNTTAQTGYGFLLRTTSCYGTIGAPHSLNRMSQTRPAHPQTPQTLPLACSCPLPPPTASVTCLEAKKKLSLLSCGTELRPFQRREPPICQYSLVLLRSVVVLYSLDPDWGSRQLHAPSSTLPKAQRASTGDYRRPAVTRDPSEPVWPECASRNISISLSSVTANDPL